VSSTLSFPDFNHGDHQLTDNQWLSSESINKRCGVHNQTFSTNHERPNYHRLFAFRRPICRLRSHRQIVALDVDTPSIAIRTRNHLSIYSKIYTLNVPTTFGVRQGGPESPPLFNLYIDFAMRIFILHATNAGLDFFKFKYTREERAVKRGPVVGTAQLDWSGYADDIVRH